MLAICSFVLDYFKKYFKMLLSIPWLNLLSIICPLDVTLSKHHTLNPRNPYHQT